MKACPTRTFPQKSTWTKQTNKQHKRVFFSCIRPFFRTTSHKRLCRPTDKPRNAYVDSCARAQYPVLKAVTD